MRTISDPTHHRVYSAVTLTLELVPWVLSGWEVGGVLPFPVLMPLRLPYGVLLLLLPGGVVVSLLGLDQGAIVWHSLGQRICRGGIIVEARQLIG